MATRTQHDATDQASASVTGGLDASSPATNGMKTAPALLVLACLLGRQAARDAMQAAKAASSKPGL